MSGVISGNMVGGATPLRTLILEDENGSQIAGVVVGKEVIFTATDNDVRRGLVYAGDSGVSTGTKNIPSYHTTQGRKAIANGSKFILSIPNYDYTKLQAIVCSFNTNLDNSVSAEQVVINDNVYNVQMSEAVSVVQKDHDNSYIDFGFTNTSGKHCVLRYFTYKEIE